MWYKTHKRDTYVSFTLNPQKVARVKSAPADPPENAASIEPGSPFVSGLANEF